MRNLQIGALSVRRFSLFIAFVSVFASSAFAGKCLIGHGWDFLRPTGRRDGQCREIFARLRVPEGVDSLNFSLSGFNSCPENPVWFDDCAVYVKTIGRRTAAH